MPDKSQDKMIYFYIIYRFSGRQLTSLDSRILTIGCIKILNMKNIPSSSHELCARHQMCFRDE
jgi:hypothetical protein